MADVLGHLHRHAGVVQAYNGHAGRQAQSEQGIDARADVENALEPGLLVDELLRRRPHDSVVCGQRAGRPDRHLGAGKCGAQAVQPGRGFGIKAAKTDAHAGFREDQTVILSNSAPSLTWSPGAYINSWTTPSAGAAIVCSIFIASITASGWPF